MKMMRRSFVQGCLSLGAGITTGAVVGCSKSPASAGTRLGELTPDPDQILELPEGFRYVVLETSGDEMDDGHPVGDRPDGMACFEGGDGRWILMRNHEVDVGNSDPSVAYDPNMVGGVSRVVVDKDSLRRVSSNYVLIGTTRNCAGGPSPWGWLSCEESEDARHGYVFLCNTSAEKTEKPQRAPALGRFKHEAAAVDPKTEIIYLTEDQRQSAFYRHVPRSGPFEGQLQALKIKDRDRVLLSDGLAVGDRFEVEWVDVEDPEAQQESCAAQAFALGAAEVNRGEGCWYFDGSVFFVSTEGGPRGLGQVFRLDPGGASDTLTLIAQAEDEDSFVNPDNITVSPAGEVFVVEDNNGPNHIWRIGPNGEVEVFARNALNGGTSELCGVCFSPDGSVMFVNIQEEGLTLAITGPFARS